METKSPGEVLAEIRRGLGWTQARLAQELGFSTVLIAKIEGGERLPSQKFLDAMSERLPDEASVLRSVAASTDQNGRRQPATGLHGKSLFNDRLSHLQTRAEGLQQVVREATTTVDRQAGEFEEMAGRFAQLMSRIPDFPEDVIVLADDSESGAISEFSRVFADAQAKTSRTTYDQISANGADAIAAITLNHALVVGLAATGVAAATIAGASSRPNLTRGLAGMDRGATVGLVASGLLLGIVVAERIAAHDLKRTKQELAERQLTQAESLFAANEPVVEQFATRVTRISEVLSFAIIAARNRLDEIEQAMVADHGVVWGNIDHATQGSIYRVAQIIRACFGLLSLPIGLSTSPTREDGDPPDVVRLDPGDAKQNAFVDASIEELLSQIAR